MLSSVAGRRLRFSVVGEADGWYDAGRELLKVGREDLLPRSELQLLGDHNVANALAAALAVHATGVDLPTIAGGLRTFRPLEHRMEPVRELAEVLWINDSKATNVASTEMAVRAVTRPFVMLLGAAQRRAVYPLGHLLAAERAVLRSRSGPIILAICPGRGSVVPGTTSKPS